MARTFCGFGAYGSGCPQNDYGLHIHDYGLHIHDVPGFYIYWGSPADGVGCVYKDYGRHVHGSTAIHASTVEGRPQESAAPRTPIKIMFSDGKLFTEITSKLCSTRHPSHLSVIMERDTPI